MLAEWHSCVVQVEGQPKRQREAQLGLSLERPRVAACRVGLEHVFLVFFR